MQYLGIGRKFLSFATSVLKKAPVKNTTAPIEKCVRVANALKKPISLGADTFERIAALGEGQIIGNLPSEMIKAIKENGGNIEIAIKKAQEGFQKAAKELSCITKLQIQKREQRIANSIVLNSENSISEIQNNAAKVLRKALKKVLPFGSKVQVNYIGSGMYGNAFKLTFLDRKGGKVFEDIVIKTYKNPEEIIKLTSLHKLEQAKKAGIETTLESIEKPIIEKVKGQRKIHGILPEAKATEYIRHFIGHPLGPEHNIVLPDMFVTGGNPFSIGRYIPSDIAQPTKVVNTLSIGLLNGDAYTVNATNIIAGRISDMGGWKKIFKELDNKISIRYFKKITNRKTDKEWLQAIERYRQEAQATKDLTKREKIMKAVELAEKVIMRGN